METTRLTIFFPVARNYRSDPPIEMVLETKTWEFEMESNTEWEDYHHGLQGIMTGSMANQQGLLDTKAANPPRTRASEQHASASRENKNGDGAVGALLFILIFAIAAALSS